MPTLNSARNRSHRAECAFHCGHVLLCAMLLVLPWGALGCQSNLAETLNRRTLNGSSKDSGNRLSAPSERQSDAGGPAADPHTNPDDCEPDDIGCGQPSVPPDSGPEPPVDSEPIDQCPEDDTKLVAGVCGCGVPEDSTDTDADGVYDCADKCPLDAAKTLPGACGCGVSELDSDNDTVPDCVDPCAQDSNKAAPGACGCGISDAEGDNGNAECLNVAGALVHRYSFDETGSLVVDSVGNGDGLVINQSLPGTGSLILDGGESDQYVELPETLLAQLSNATFETWLVWDGGASWQRIFDFGRTDVAAGEQGQALSYLYLSALVRPSEGSAGPRVAYRPEGGAEVALRSTNPIPEGEMTHLAVVFDAAGGALSLFVNGELEGEVTAELSLPALNSVNHWLGRSQFPRDDELGAAVDEFRIYSEALTAEQIQLSFSAGPDPDFLRLKAR